MCVAVKLVMFCFQLGVFQNCWILRFRIRFTYCCNKARSWETVQPLGSLTSASSKNASEDSQNWGEQCGGCLGFIKLRNRKKNPDEKEEKIPNDVGYQMTFKLILLWYWSCGNEEKASHWFGLTLPRSSGRCVSRTVHIKLHLPLGDKLGTKTSFWSIISD